MDPNPYKKVTIAIGIAFIIDIPIWLWFAVPALTKIPSDFSYKANVLSLDNFYDEAKKEFSGEKRSVTNFSYEAVTESKGVLTVKNTFDVRTVAGARIFDVDPRPERAPHWPSA